MSGVSVGDPGGYAAINRDSFSEWFNSEDSIVTRPSVLSLCLDDATIDRLGDSGLKAGRLLEVLLVEHFASKSIRAVEYEHGLYYRASELIEPSSKRVHEGLERRCDLSPEDYSLMVMTLTEMNYLNMAWLDIEHFRELVLAVQLDRIATEWRERTDEGRNSFDPDGYIYVLRAGDYYKIGRSTTVSSRIKQLKIQLPFPVEVYALIACDDHVISEHLAHDIYRHERVNGEWFHIPDESRISWMQQVDSSQQNRAGLPEWVMKQEAIRER